MSARTRSTVTGLSRIQARTTSGHVVTLEPLAGSLVLVREGATRGEYTCVGIASRPGETVLSWVMRVVDDGSAT